MQFTHKNIYIIAPPISLIGKTSAIACKAGIVREVLSQE